MNTDDCCVAQNAFICVYLRSSVDLLCVLSLANLRAAASFLTTKSTAMLASHPTLSKKPYSLPWAKSSAANTSSTFSCSGQIGLEACSRGAQVVINEPDRRCNRFIAQLIDNWHLNDRIELYARPAQKLLPQLAHSNALFDIIYLDPPYHQQLDGQPMPCAMLTRLATTPILAPNARVLVQHASQTTLPKSLPNLALSREKKYGDTTLSTYINK